MLTAASAPMHSGVYGTGDELPESMRQVPAAEATAEVRLIGTTAGDEQQQRPCKTRDKAAAQTEIMEVMETPQASSEVRVRVSEACRHHAAALETRAR
jgi:hypothetical protein